MARYELHKKSSLAELEPMILRAQEEIAALAQGKRFRMSVPVDDTDSDMVIGDALRHALAFVRAALNLSPSVDAIDPVEGMVAGRPRASKDSVLADVVAVPPPPQEPR